jgi:opacity protein-like surface antigen
MKRIAIAAAAAIAMLSTAAQAQTAKTSPVYGEVGYTQFKFKEEGVGSVKPNALRGIVGYEFHPNVAVEGMLAFGISDDSISVDEGFGPINVDLKLQHAYGIYVKPKFNVTPEFEVFGRLGYTQAKFKATASFAGVSVSESDSDGDVSYGLGAAYRFNPRMSVGLDYMRYSDKDGVKVDGVTVSFGYRF